MPKLYVIPLSHSALAAKLMLEHKGVRHRTVRLVSGLHPIWLRLVGFPRGTVPALRVGGERVQGSLAISRFLERIAPEPPLFPSDLALRAEVERAEAWGERELQGVPRRLLRWALVRDPALRRMLAQANRLPLPGAMALVMKPLAAHFAKRSGADDQTVRRDIAELPGLLDRVDALVVSGVVGARAPNAAAFQIGPSVRLLMNFTRLEPLFAGRPSARFARELLPEYPGRVETCFPWDDVGSESS